MEVALRRWPETGVPDEPRAWLTTVVRDDLLRLVFTCCPPALRPEAQVALALRTLCGLATADVARLLLVPEATAAKRLTRAKQKIAVAAIPYRVPEAKDLPDRVGTVATVVHLLFTAGHSGGETVVRPQLCDEAIRLGRLLVDLMPDEAQLQGLLAPMLLTDARLAAGRFELQAAIAACHAQAPSLEQTDWADVVALYDALLRVEDTAVVRLNRAVAVGELTGPAAGLAALDAVPGLERLHLWHACRAEQLLRLGRRALAVQAWEAALACDPSPPEAAFIRDRLAPHRADGPDGVVALPAHQREL